MLKGVLRWRPEFMASRLVEIQPPAALGSTTSEAPSSSLPIWAPCLGPAPWSWVGAPSPLLLHPHLPPRAAVSLEPLGILAALFLLQGGEKPVAFDFEVHSSVHTQTGCTSLNCTLLGSLRERSGS